MKIYKRGKNWWIDYTAQGVRHRQSTGTTNRATALAFMSQIDTARKMPTFEAAVEILRHFYNQAPAGKLPIEAIWETYERVASAIGKRPSENTNRIRRNRIERLIEWLNAKRATIRFVEHLSAPIAADYAAYLAGGKLKTKTRRNIIGDLTSVWNILEKASGDIRNPWTKLAPPDTDGKRGKNFTPEQALRVLEACDTIGKDWGPICRLMLLTGQRYGDICRLKWSEIEENIIRLIPHKTARHNIEVIIPITAAIREVLNHIERRGDYLFPLHAEVYDQRGRKQVAGLMFREVLDAAGITGEGYTIHSFRHTAATRLADAGVDKETRKKILGHTVDATAERYDHAQHLPEITAALEKLQ